MPLNKKQQKLAAVAGLGCLSVLIDRVFLAPSSAVADTPVAVRQPDTESADTAATTETSPEDPGVVKAQLAERFEEIATVRGLDATRVPDAFQIPGAWLPEDGAEIRPVIVDDPGTIAAVENFKSAHRLNAVMANRGSGYAIVDGKRLRIGQKLDGFELVTVRERSIVLERNGIEVVLSLPGRLRPRE